MIYHLEPLRKVALSNMETGQLIKRHLADLNTIESNLFTDESFNAYVRELARQSELYDKALAQVRKNAETEKVKQAGIVRDKTIRAFLTALKLYSLSDDEPEINACRSLQILTGSFKNLPRLNYEAKTLAVDKLVSELESEHYSSKVAFLQMSRYVDRMKNANRDFAALFSGRMVAEATAEAYNMKLIRKEMLRKYSDFTAYVLAMAKATENPLFISSLNLLNAARKYYSELVARRAIVKVRKEKPETV
jgi:hypothetical protein